MTMIGKQASEAALRELTISGTLPWAGGTLPKEMDQFSPASEIRDAIAAHNRTVGMRIAYCMRRGCAASVDYTSSSNELPSDCLLVRQQLPQPDELFTPDQFPEE